MAKSRATLRPVIAPGRVPQAVHQVIKQAAASSGRSMAEELAALAASAIEHRKRFGDFSTARAMEMATLGFIAGGERKAQETGINQPWASDLECRREAVLAACSVLITQFLSPDPEQQALTVEALKGRIWTAIVRSVR